MSQTTQTDREPKIDKWFHGDHEQTDTYAGLRGDTMVRAVNGNRAGSPPIVPVGIEPEELSEYDEIPEWKVPDWAKRRIKDRFRATDAAFDVALGRDSPKEDNRD